MDHQRRLERLLIGLRGLGLLRAWPLGDQAVREAADLGLTGLPLLLIWVLRAP